MPPYPKEHTAAADKNLEYLWPRLLWFLLARSPSNGNKDYPPPYIFCCIRMMYLEGMGTKRGRGRRKEIRSRRRSLPYMTESTEIDRRRRQKEVGIDDEDKESMDEGTMSDI
jgi:hypothetical protein